MRDAALKSIPAALRAPPPGSSPGASATTRSERVDVASSIAIAAVATLALLAAIAILVLRLGAAA